MKKSLKRTFAFVLVLALTLTMFSASAFAVSDKIKFRAQEFSKGSVEVEYGNKTKDLKSNDTISFDKKSSVTAYSVRAYDIDKGYMFEKWVDENGDSLGSNNPLIRSVKPTNRITPVFVETVKLTLKASPEHGGNVDAKINGTWETVYDEETFKVAKDSNVKIIAFREREDDKYKFISFGGDKTSNNDEITVKMNSDKTIVANFRVAVKPILEFVVDNGDDSYTAHFGYEVDGQEKTVVSVGSKNKVFGGGVSGQNMGQPITFSPGRHYDAFQVKFNGSKLSWKLENKTVEATVDEDELRFTVRPELFAYGDLKIENAVTGGDIFFNGEEFENGAREIYVPCYTRDEPTKLTLTAIPDEGLSFYSWADNSSTLNPRTITFKESWFGKKNMVQRPDPIFETGEVMLTINAGSYGTTSIAKKVYNAGDVVIIEDVEKYITANSGYSFVGFKEKSGSHPYKG